MNRRKKLLIGGGIVGALAAVLLLGGLATGVLAQSTVFSNPAITADEAQAAALQAYPGTSAVEVELEREHGKLIYEVGLDNGLEVMVDADTGALQGLDQEEDEAKDEVEVGVEDSDDAEDDDGPDEIAPANTGITADDARAIAEEAYPGATVLEIEFDRASGVDLFEAELDNGDDVRIDAHTGEILGTEIRDNN